MDLPPIRVRETKHGAIMCTDITPDVAMCIKVIFKPKRIDENTEKLIEKLKKIYINGAYMGLAMMAQSKEMLKTAIETMTKELKDIDTLVKAAKESEKSDKEKEKEEEE